MKRYLSILFCLVFLGGYAQPAAQSRAAEIVGALAARFRALKAYEVGFSLSAGDYSVSGGYVVEGERYCLRVGDAEVFGDGLVRYEVDRGRREVTIVGVGGGSRNLLNDPVHAFDFLDSGYEAVLLWEREGKAAVRLVPAADGAISSGVITLIVRTSDFRPLSLVYDFDGEAVSVTVDSLRLSGALCPSFDAQAYSGFEVIDFR